MLTNRRGFLGCTLKSVGTAISLAAIFGEAPCAWAQGNVEPNAPVAEKAASAMLFFDDWPLDRRDHVERHIGRPQLHPEATFADPHLNVSWGYPSVFRDTESGVWRCLYQGWDFDRTRLYPVVAESEDGIKWHTPDLSSIHLLDRAYPHQVLPVAEFSEWNPCYYDERAIPSERLKGFVFRQADSRAHPKSYLWVSPDGLHWQCLDGVRWQIDTPDPVTSAFWNKSRSKYVLTTRPSLNDRRIAVVETADWRMFSEPELSLEADALDTPLAQTYAMPVFPYENDYVGLLWIFHVSLEVKGQSPLKYLGGKVDCQLTYSRNGWHFERGLREVFIPNTDPGTPGAGCIQPSCMILDGDTIRIYGSASAHEHGILVPGDGALVLHTLRRDGFTYLESVGGPGVIGTRPLFWQGNSSIEFNVSAPDGEARVQITDSKGDVLPGYSFEQCVPFSRDEIRWEPRWKDRPPLRGLPQRTLRVEVLLDDARLYAIRGDFKVLTAAEVRRYEQRGEIPGSFQEKN
jgi:hypothetical protein